MVSNSLAKRFTLQIGRSTRSLIATLVVSASALVGIAGYESYRGTAYLDSGGVPTLGYGTTEGVKLGDKTTPERALLGLLKDANGAGAGLKRCITAPLYQHEFEAYVSLAYNVGIHAVCRSSIPRKLSAGDYPAACATILEFDGVRDCSKPKVWNEKTRRWECPIVKLPGLTKRRHAEWLTCTGASA
jgi:lysozyme